MENGGLKEKKGICVRKSVDFWHTRGEGREKCFGREAWGNHRRGNGLGCLENGLGAVDCGRQGLIWL